MRDKKSFISDLALYDTPSHLARLLFRYIESNQTNRYVIPLFYEITHKTITQMIGSTRQVLKQEGI